MSLPGDHDVRMARAMLALEGVSLGDGFGERYFGAPHRVLPAIQGRELPHGPWRWTDDTVMAICITETLEEHGGIDQDSLVRAFARRYREDPVRGYGRGAHTILGEILAGAPWRQVAGAVFDGGGSMGNGAAMRVAPIGAYFADDLEAVVHHAAASAEPTHAHPDGKAGGIAIAVATALAHGDGREQSSTGEELLATVIEHTPEGPTREGLRVAEQLGLSCEVAVAADRLGTGSNVISSDTVPFCVWSAARNLGQFETAMWETVSGLGDRDTTCAIVGGILAGNVGMGALPAEWRLRREALPDPLTAPLPRQAAP
ncbi:MAG: ADP-ribosylglycohydrolase family protein [Myxococcales bacterium]|nr:ADP-ribosylglycohydrolase family protein [Myxococcales bacterium]